MLLVLALRNLIRNRRRSLLTLSAMVVSSSLLILALGIFSGMIADMLSSATEQYHGHMVASRAGYQEDRDLFANFRLTKELAGLIESQPEVQGVSQRVRTFGLMSHDLTTQPVEILGVIPDRERGVTTLQHHLVSGHYLAGSDSSGAIIGRGLARKLGVEPGDELVFLTQAADGSIGNDLLTVTGIFATGDTGHDNSLVMVHLEWIQRVAVLPNRLHELAIHIDDPLEAAPLAHRLTPLLPQGMELIDWGRLMPEMNEAIASYDISRFIIITILYFATGLGILNTFFMSIMERTREFGILMAIGVRPWRIRGLVLLESLLLGLVSLVLGIGLGLLMTLYMRDVGIDLSAHMTPVTYAGGTILPRLQAVVEPANFVLPSVCLLVVCLLAGFFPANRAARLNPVEALRED